MNITSTKLRPNLLRPAAAKPSHAPSQDHQAPDSVTFSSDERPVLKAVASFAGAGAGVFAAQMLTGFSPGVGGVANAVVGGVGLGVMGVAGLGGLMERGSAEDKMAGALATLLGGGAGVVAGGILGGMGYNYPVLVAGAGALVGSALARSLVDR
jgi:hypothetical protein